MRIHFFKLLLLIAVLILSAEITFTQVSWTKYSGNPVIPAGQNGEWNRQKFMPSILFNTDSSRYELWYSASIYPAGSWRPYRIGYATSEDGINWTVRPDAVLTPGTTGEWDESTVEAAYVIRENDQYKMWYTSGSGKIGYATSPDGINWTKYSGNPIFEAGTQSWESGGVYLGCVMPVTGGYTMWYSGWTAGLTHESIGYATSTDGIFWQRDTLNNPVMEDGTSGTWDDVGVYLPSVLFIDNLYYMWYGGMGSIVQIGLATSYDGISWVKHSANPVLKPSPGQWDDYYVEEGRVIFMDDTLYMWYGASGGSGSNYVWQIGLAKSFFIPLPVELASFTATSNGKEVILNWSTATEINNQMFEVQRSFEGSEFATIGFVNGKGTTTERQDYTYRDKIFTDGKYSYRLKQIDYLGSYEYSDIIDIDLRAFNSYLLEQNYPNPFNPTTTIGFGIREKSSVKITVLNSIGEEVALVLNEEREAGFYQVEFNAANLPSGVYFYQLKAGDFIQTRKMILLK